MSAKGLDKHHARQSELSSFGKDLARRCKSHCELCDAHGVKLAIFEVPPVPKQPEFESCIFVCENCQQQIEKPKTLDINHWHCLHTSAWSEHAPVQVMAVLMLKRIQDKADWAEELLDQLYLTEEVQEWVGKAEAEK